MQRQLPPSVPGAHAHWRSLGLALREPEAGLPRGSCRNFAVRACGADCVRREHDASDCTSSASGTPAIGRAVRNRREMSGWGRLRTMTGNLPADCSKAIPGMDLTAFRRQAQAQGCEGRGRDPVGMRTETRGAVSGTWTSQPGFPPGTCRTRQLNLPPTGCHRCQGLLQVPSLSCEQPPTCPLHWKQGAPSHRRPSTDACGGRTFRRCRPAPSSSCTRIFSVAGRPSPAGHQDISAPGASSWQRCRKVQGTA
jgi:hypothetical protein